jgi:hypothetical protein
MSGEVIAEQTWPIYEFEARWTFAKPKPKVEEYDDRHGLPEGRAWNSTSWDAMFREEKTSAELDEVLMKFWREYARKGAVAELFSLHARFLRKDTWCLTWFSHYTFDVGQSDADALASFERYVQHKEREAREKGEDVNVMGAEDRWRWRAGGPVPDGGSTEPLSPPCRCDGCKKAGVIRIDH